MSNLKDLPRIKGFRIPRSVIGYAVWAYHRFALSLHDVEDRHCQVVYGCPQEPVACWVQADRLRA